MMVMLMLPAAAFAANATSVWIKGVELTGTAPYYRNGAGEASTVEAGYNAYFNAAAGTLTLNGLEIEDSAATITRNTGLSSFTYAYAIYAEGDLTLYLNGENRISVRHNQQTGDNAYVVVLGVKDGVLTVAPGVTGSGSLTAESKGATSTNADPDANTTAQCFGISADDLTVNAGVTLKGLVSNATTAKSSMSVGVSAAHVHVKGGTLLGTAGTADGGSGLSAGIYLLGDGGTLILDTGRVEAIGGNALDVSYGIGMSSGRININGGSFLAKTGTASSMWATAVPLTFASGVTGLGSTSADGSNSAAYTTSANGTYRWVSVSPALTASASPSGSVTAGTAVTLTAVPGSITNPTFQWYSYSTGATSSASAITGATSDSYAPPTDTAGTVYYFCKANGGAASNVVGVTVTAPVITVTSVAVNPASVRIQKGGRQTFSADVRGQNNPAQTVNWTVEGGVTGTRIDSKGILSVDGSETATTLTVRATSTVDNTVSGTATVTVGLLPPASPDPILYRIIRGQDGKWTKNSAAGLGFTADCDYEEFWNVWVDESVISRDDYTSEEGSTIVTLKASYLETLSIGRHTLRINFLNGYAETHFTIRAATVPATGDSAQPLLWLGIALLACAGLTAGLIIRRKRRNG